MHQANPYLTQLLAETKQIIDETLAKLEALRRNPPPKPPPVVSAGTPTTPGSQNSSTTQSKTTSLPPPPPPAVPKFQPAPNWTPPPPPTRTDWRSAVILLLALLSLSLLAAFSWTFG